MQQRSPRRLLALLLVPVFLGGADTTLFNSVTNELPVLTDAWRLWFIDGYAIALSATVVLGSRLGARYGPGRMLAIGLLLFGASSATPTLIHMTPVWVTSRCLEGAGYALMISSVVSCMGLLFEGEQRTKAYSYWAVASSLGAGIGPLVGRGALTLDAYPWLFWGPTAVAISCGLLTAAWLRNLRAGDSAASELDAPSAGLAFAGFALLIGALQGNMELLFKLVAATLGAGILFAFGLRQKHADDPLIDIGMLRPSALGLYPFAIIFSYAAYTGAVYGFGSSSRSWGALLAVSLLALWVAVGGFTFPCLQRRLNPGPLLGAGSAACALGLTLAALSNLWIAGPLLGIGVGVTSTASASYLLDEAKLDDVARAGALQETSFAAGSALGVAIFGGLMVATRSLPTTCFAGAALLLTAGLLPHLAHTRTSVGSKIGKSQGIPARNITSRRGR